ncbi:hypothetical protein MBLNU13_g05221t2 [Cladosporium sp. NU13]
MAWQRPTGPSHTHPHPPPSDDKVLPSLPAAMWQDQAELGDVLALFSTLPRLTTTTTFSNNIELPTEYHTIPINKLIMFRWLGGTFISFWREHGVYPFVAVHLAMYTAGMYYAVRENFFRAGARAEDDDTIVVTSPGPTVQGCEASTFPVSERLKRSKPASAEKEEEKKGDGPGEA